MKIVTYGGGTNSTAMLIGMVKQGIIPDRILFSDTGGEHPYRIIYLLCCTNYGKIKKVRIR